MKEYKTTCAQWLPERWERDSSSSDGGYALDADIPDPVMPQGAGEWRMVGSAATSRCLFWFWERVTKRNQKS